MSSQDSLQKWQLMLDSPSTKISEKRRLLFKLQKLINEKGSDSLKNKVLSKVAYHYLKLEDSIEFKRTNKNALIYAIKVEDSFAIGDLHWNYASYYNKQQIYDSAYYHFKTSYRFFESLDDQYHSAKMLYAMSFIRARYRDYTGSEILNIRAIEKYKDIEDYESLYTAYNHLALIYEELKEFDKALLYHKMGLNYLKKSDDKKNKYVGSLNNLGLIYHKMGQYKIAIDFFDEALRLKNIKQFNLNLYAKLIDNRAYSRLKNLDTTDVRTDFYLALSIRDSLKNKSGMVINNLHLAEYYLNINDLFHALKFSRKANIIAKEIKNNRDYLASLKLLASIDAKNSQNYLNRYISYNDSLISNERKVQNKFTRIAYETEEYIEKTKRLSQQKIVILIISISGFFILLLLYTLKTQKSKNIELYLETEQQKANEQIYILTLKQQSKLEEEKIIERNRISEELHDGILSKLFGTRLGLGFLDITGDKEVLLQHQNFLDELQEIEKEIREVSHKLSTNFSFSEINFTTILNQFLKNKSKIGGFEYLVDNDENIEWQEINEITKVNLYRILQEALQNIVKYAHATLVILRICRKDKMLLVEIIDNGKGFNTVKYKNGIGIKNMKSRSKKMNGSFKIASKVGEGTSITLLIPINNYEKHASYSFNN
ncbi:sensor histidine kinase [Aquimarina sp. 2-A2]|uniref:ATP-binding protein n=1 Tax=Aquimarina sp. 2-A2 TaxID=3382644 RepID=UPI00387F0FE5